MSFMDSKIFSYPFRIKESYLDTFGHMNNAHYLTLFEEARWDLMNASGYSISKIRESGLGPTILEVKVRYMKELRLGDEVTIQTQLQSYQRKIGKIEQKMLRGEELCCVGEFTIALFSLEARKLVAPTPEWLQALRGLA
jgi:acyl-CoA thioester hydrolase